jgi:hypothetical protein
LSKIIITFQIEKKKERATEALENAGIKIKKKGKNKITTVDCWV